jgi:FlaA1/EpsC-like NDP-sugar epimerase
MVMIYYQYGFLYFSRAAFLLDGLLTLLLTGTVRLIIRYFFQSDSTLFFYPLSQKNGKNVQKVIIVGAGDAGEKILREISENQTLNYKVEGFLDDNIKKIGRTYQF